SFNVRNTFEELSIVLRQPIIERDLSDVVPRFKFSRSLFRGLHSRFRLLLVCHLRRFQFLRSRPQALYLLFLGSERRHKRVVVRELDRLAARPVGARLCPVGAISGHSLFVSVFVHCYISLFGWWRQSQYGWGRIKAGVLAHLIQVGTRPGAVLIKQLLRLRITSSGTLTQLIDALRRHIGAHGHFFSGLIPRRRGTTVAITVSSESYGSAFKNTTTTGEHPTEIARPRRSHALPPSGLRVVDRRPLYSVPTRLQHILLNRIQQERQHQLRRLSKQMPSTITQTLLHKPLRKRIYHLRPIPPRHTFEIAKFVVPVHRVKGHLLPIEGSQLRHLAQQHITRPLRVTKIQRPEKRL